MDEAVSPPPLPRQIARYQIQRRLGYGGFAEVFLATDTHLDRSIALKVARFSYFGPDPVADVFLREARAVAQLQHPNIVTVHEIGSSDEHGPFIAMEYLPGGTLSARLKDGRLSVAEAVCIVAQVAEGVHYAHRKEIVHRDLKPSNILFAADDVPKVSDFGLALREEAQPEHRGEVSGTPSYMSPEQVSGSTHLLDGRSDIWSLGVILYQCLAGKLPFRGRTTDELYDEILHRDPKPLRQVSDQIPPELDELCRQCLSKNPADRPATALDVARRLKEIGPVPETKPRPLRAVVVVVALAMLTMALAFAVLPNREASVAVAPELALGNAHNGEWRSLLQQPPRRLVFDSATPINTHDHDPQLERFVIDCNTWGMFSCAPNMPRNGEVRLAISKGSRSGVYGVFWGFHRDRTRLAPPDPRRPHNAKPLFPHLYRARAVTVYANQSMPEIRLVDLELQHLDAERLCITKITRLDRAVLNAPLNEPMICQMQLESGRLKALQLDGTRLPVFDERQAESESFAAGELGWLSAGPVYVVTELAVRSRNGG